MKFLLIPRNHGQDVSKFSVEYDCEYEAMALKKAEQIAKALHSVLDGCVIDCAVICTTHAYESKIVDPLGMVTNESVKK